MLEIPNKEMLKWPTKKFKEKLGQMDCPHEGKFDLCDKYCWECMYGEECRTLHKINRADGNKSLFPILHTAYNQLNRQGSLKNHHIKNCSCADCRWLKSVQKTLGLFHFTP